MRYCPHRYLYIFLIFTVLLGSWHHTASAQSVVFFPDPNLDRVVRDRLNLDDNVPIPKTSVEGLLFFLVSEEGITNLEGLQYATGLLYLQLKDNLITDFTPIESCTELISLNLINTGFSDSDISILQPLSKLSVGLHLGKNKISDLQRLVNVISGGNIPDLYYLALGNNNFHDITPLTALKPQLQRLALQSIRIRDFSPLADLTNLTRLWLEGTGISNLEPLRNLVTLTELHLDSNQISDLEPLSGLTDLRTLWMCYNPFPPDPNPFKPLENLGITSFRVDTTYKTQAMAVFPNIDPRKLRFCAPRPEPTPELEPETETLFPEPEPKATRRKYITQCGLGWSPQSQYQHHGELPKVMIYALEFEYDAENHGTYTCKTIEIRTGDDSIENLAGWDLYLGTLYNPSRIPLKIPEEHSQITGRILRITPEMLGLETFPCNTVNGISHPLPGVQYVLKTDENVSVDTAYSCFIYGQNAYTTINDKNVKSQRSISSAALREMETPRLERYITNATGVYITYMDIEAFTWDRAVLSDWLLALSKETVAGSPTAPFLPNKKLTTTWGALKKHP